MKLTDYQKMFLLDMAKDGYGRPPEGYRGAGADASRWYRTAEILKNRGLVWQNRSGCAFFTWPGLAWTIELLKETP